MWVGSASRTKNSETNKFGIFSQKYYFHTVKIIKMKICRSLLILFVFHLTVFTSCNKAIEKKEPEITIDRYNTWFIGDFAAKVELKEQSDSDKELTEQFENEIKIKMASIGDIFVFIPDEKKSNTGVLGAGKLNRYFRENEEKITSDYLIEKTNDNILYLKIIENDTITDVFKIDTNSGFLLKDFTEEYSQFNNRIVLALGGARITIPL